MTDIRVIVRFYTRPTHKQSTKLSELPWFKGIQYSEGTKRRSTHKQERWTLPPNYLDLPLNSIPCPLTWDPMADIADRYGVDDCYVIDRPAWREKELHRKLDEELDEYFMRCPERARIILDRELDEYFMQCPERARIILDRELDEYFKNDPRRKQKEASKCDDISWVFDRELEGYDSVTDCTSDTEGTF